MKLMLLVPLTLGIAVACSKSNDKKSSSPNPPVHNNQTPVDDDGEVSPVSNNGKTNICGYSFEEDKSFDHFSVLNRTWRSSNEILKSEKEIDGEVVEVLGGFSLDSKEYRYLSFLFDKFEKEHRDIVTDDNRSFKFKKIAISKPLTDGKFKGHRLIAMSGISEHSLDMECITTSYKLDRYGQTEELSMAGWTASSSIGDTQGNSKESFFEDKYERGYIQK